MKFPFVGEIANFLRSAISSVFLVGAQPFEDNPNIQNPQQGRGSQMFGSMGMTSSLLGSKYGLVVMP